VHWDDSILWVQVMLDKLSIPHLSEFGLCEIDLNEIVDDALKSVAIKGNPLPLTRERLLFVLNQVCDCHCKSAVSDSALSDSEESMTESE
jgi:alcohol dehydrogenase class IV